ncbi:MAG: hypothetical protein GXO87_14040 [Chlorobi bacterium]|nr:hypothetical protein [Chlorobiota bacterium]
MFKNLFQKYLPVFFLTVSFAFGQITKEKIDSINSLDYEYIVSNISETNQLFKKNVRNADSINYLYGKAKALSNLGLTNYFRGNYDESTSNYLEAMKYFERLKEYKLLAYAMGEFGYQMKLRNLSKAFQYMKQGIDLAVEHNYKNLLTGLYNNIGVLYEMNNRLDSANFYYQKSLGLAYELKDSLSIPYSLNRIAGVYLAKGDYNTALNYLSQSDEIRNKEKGKYGRAENLSFRADIFEKMGELDSAIVYNLKCLDLSKGLNYTKLTQYSYERLSVIYELKNDFKNALLFFKKSTAIQDSINATETNIRIADLELDYETVKKDKRLAENKLKIRKQTSLLILLSGLVFFSLLLSYFIYRYQKIKRARKETELELAAQIQKSEFVKKMSEEKLRISRELHDNIGAQLTFLISSLDNLSYVLKENNLIDKLKSISRFGRVALDELRTTIWAMKHEATGLKGLELKLNDLKRHITSANPEFLIEITNAVEKKIFLSSAQNLNLYRIAQEAIQNSLKYSGCKRIDILFQDTSDGFELIISDDGCGFNVEENKRDGGNGLKNMEFRCGKAGGSFSIESGNSGTKISCKIKTV